MKSRCSTSATTAAVEARNIGFSYGRLGILDDVSFEVGPGEIVGLVGPNGSGKTTLLRVAGGTLAPQKGEVHIYGQQLLSLSPKDRARQVAMVHQNPAVPPGLTALDVVLMGRNPHLGLLQWEGRRDLEICYRMMGLTKTGKYAHRRVSSLSGGELQRVFIARALAQETPVLVLDEPTAHLDITYQTSVLDIVEKVRSEIGVSVLIAMHDLTLAGQYCDRIIALHNRSIYASGMPEEVLTAEVISEVFGAPVSVFRHPAYNTLVVLPTGSQEERNRSAAQ